MAGGTKVDPFNIEALERAVNDSATRVSAIWTSFVVFSLYLLVAATTITQRQLLLADPIKLPVLNIDLPLWGFFFLAPMLFAILHAYVLLQVLLLGRTTAAYNAAVLRAELSPEENTSLRQRLANTLFAQIFAGSPRERDGFVGFLLRIIVWITLAIGPLLIVLTFQFSFLAYHSHLATWAHRLLVLIELSMFFLIWPLALDAQRDFGWPTISANLKPLFRLFGISPAERKEEPRVNERSAVFAASAIVIGASFSLASFPGEPHVNLLTGKPLLSVQCERLVQRQFGGIDLRFDRLDLRGIDIVDDGKLAEIEKQSSARDQAPYESARTRDFRGRNLNCSDLSSADFRRVDLTNASLAGAMLDRTAFDGASLDSAKLEMARLGGAHMSSASMKGAHVAGAWLSGAQLGGAKLGHVDMQGTSLDSADLRGADLGDANLKGATLRNAFMQGANMGWAKMQGAALIGARMTGASVTGANLQGATLEAAILEGTTLQDADLRGAFLLEAALGGAFLLNAKLDLAVINGAYVWRARHANCLKAKVGKLNKDAIIVLENSSVGARNWVAVSAEQIAKFIDLQTDAIPATRGRLDNLRWQLKGALVPDANDAETTHAAAAWDECEQESLKMSEEDVDRDHAALLRKLVCDGDDRQAVARGIVNVWLWNTAQRKQFSLALARGLLSQDGKDCAATGDLDQDTRRRLTAVLAKQ